MIGWRVQGALAVLALATLGCSGLAEVPDPVAPVRSPAPAGVARIDDLLDPIRADHDVPALAAAVVQHGRIVAIGAVGVRALGDETPVTVDDRWHIGSDAKAITATMLARLVTRGTVSWDDDVSIVLADLDPDPGWRGVTLAHLVHHTGGVPPNPSLPWMLRLLAATDTPTQARRRLLASVLATPPQTPPGTVHAYSNLGYILAGAMAEARTGRTWFELIQSEVAEPLGMTDLGLGSPGPGSPWGHRGEAAPLTPVAPGRGADNPPAFGPAGTLHLTLTSWAAFVAAHVAGAQGDVSYLPAEAWTWLHTPALDGYAAGWGVVERDWAGGTALTHAGSNTMWFAVAWLAPNKDTALLAVTNCASASAGPATDAAIAALIERYVTSGVEEDGDSPALSTDR